MGPGRITRLILASGAGRKVFQAKGKQRGGKAAVRVLSARNSRLLWVWGDSIEGEKAGS